MGFQHKDSYRQCTAKSKRSGVQCKNAAMRNRHVCRMHGGKSHRGMQSKAHYHGYYAKDFYSRFVWSQIKLQWRDAIQSLRLAIVLDETPKTNGIRTWSNYRVKALAKMREPIPDIPSDTYLALWQAYQDNGPSGV